MEKDIIARTMARKAARVVNLDVPSKAIKRIAVSTRGSHLQQGLSDGVVTVQTSVTTHTICCDCTDVALVCGNYYGNSSGGEQLTPNPIVIKATVYHNGVRHEMYFPNGDNEISLKPGAMIETVTSGINAKAGDTLEIRTLVKVNTGEKFPVGQVVQANRGEGYADSDILNSGVTTGVGKFVYHPIAIVGRPKVPTPAVLLVGDSIMAGADDTPQDAGFAVRALGSSIPWIRIAQGNESGYNFKGDKCKLRMRLAKYCTHAICNYGTNDLMSSEFAIYQADIQKIWQLLADYGLKVFQTTITPRTTSTDVFYTPENQTPVNVRFGATGARYLANSWLRSDPSPLLSGVFDVTKPVESGVNTGMWAGSVGGVDNTRRTREGVHPWTKGHELMASEIDIRKIVL